MFLKSGAMSESNRKMDTYENVFLQRLHTIGSNHGHRASPESPTRHSTTENAVESRCEFHESIQLRAGHLEFVPDHQGFSHISGIVTYCNEL
jgi:hypothetical protein